MFDTPLVAAYAGALLRAGAGAATVSGVSDTPWDEELARSIEDALAGSGSPRGRCHHPFAALTLADGNLACRLCSTNWPLDHPVAVFDVLGRLLETAQSEIEMLNGRVTNLEDALMRTGSLRPCPVCGRFLRERDGVTLAKDERCCPPHLAVVLWRTDGRYRRGVQAWMERTHILESDNLLDRWVYEQAIATDAHLKIDDDTFPMLELPGGIAERLVVPTYCRYQELVDAVAALLDVAAPRTRTGAAQLLGIAACAAHSGSVGDGGTERRWAEVASQAWLPDPASRVTAFADLYRDSLEVDSSVDAGFADDALGVLTQRAAELLLGDIDDHYNN